MDSEITCPVISLIQELFMEEYGGGGMGCKSSEASVFSLSSISKEHATMPCWKQDTRLGGAVV